ncbi:MAG: DUF2490 domain-containing protein [Candidatus Omnitrophica bacterium]|nr:DUF2490 domain-containing protein [Candidatus Omnitrophota bacterium]
MRKIKITFIFLLLFTYFHAGYAYEDGDFQVWNTDSEEKKINDKFKLTMDEEFRWENNASRLIYHHYEPGLTYMANKHLDISLKYRQVYEKKNGKFREENQPNLNVTLKEDFFGFGLEDRSRLEYRHFDYQPDSWRYRNKFTAKAPWKFTRFGIQPYLADEIFINFYNAAFSKNRFYAGLGLNIIKDFKAELYYMLESTRSSGRWIDANVLGTKFKIAF